MPIVDLPDIKDITQANMPDVIAKMNKALQYIINGGNIDSDNILDNGISDLKISGVDGSKLVDASVLYDKLGKTRIYREFAISLPPNSSQLYTINHSDQVLYKNALPPMVRPKGSITNYGYDVIQVAWAFFNNEVIATCRWYEEGVFCYQLDNISPTATYTGTVEWYRDGIYK